MSVIWNDEEIALLESLRPSCNAREIQSVFKSVSFERSMEAISKKARQLGLSFKDFGIPNTSGLSSVAKESIAQMLETRQEDLLAIGPTVGLTSSQKSQRTVRLRESCTKLLNDLKEIRTSVPKIGSVNLKRASGNKESLVIILSDNHFGRIVKDENGIIIYNMQIAAERVMSTASLLLKTLSKERIANIDEAVVVLLGDHADGEGVFPGQEMLLEDHVAEQTKQCVKAFWHVIKQLRSLFPLVRIVTSKGNHGRGGSSPESNWDNMIFQQLELLVDLESDPGLTIKNKYGDFATIDVKGWKGLMRHKAPVHANSGASIQKFAGWYGIHHWDWFAFGHWHHWGVMTWNSKPIFRNGSIMGGDDYAETLAVHDAPVQLCFCVTETELPSRVIPLFYK